MSRVSPEATAPSSGFAAATVSAAPSATSSEQPASVVHYPVKWVIDDLGQHRPICMQNNNGPCALLALANATLLTGETRIEPGTTKVREDSLMGLLAEYVSSRPNPTSSGSGGASESANGNTDNDNQQAAAREFAINDFLDLMPRLNRGMDVNVRFSSPMSFEFTRELSVFDVFPTIRLVHGWLVDPQDIRLTVAISHLSYNRLVDELVRTEEPAPVLADTGQAVATAPPPEAFDDLPVEEAGHLSQHVSLSEYADNIYQTTLGEHTEERSYPDFPGHDVYTPPIADHLEAHNEPTVMQVPALPIDTQPDAPPVDPPVAPTVDPPVAPTVDHPVAPTVDHPVAPTVDHPVVPTDEQLPVPTDEQPPLTDISSESPETANIREMRPHIVDFLQSNSTQLTVYGLHQLHETLRENETAILFRNSHFYVLRKYRGEIYTLVTDEGFLDELNTVWEKLTDVTGDSTFYTGAFERISASGAVIPNMKSKPSGLRQTTAASQNSSGRAAQGQAGNIWSGKAAGTSHQSHKKKNGKNGCGMQ